MKTTLTLELITDEHSNEEIPALIQRQIDAQGRKIEIIRFIRGTILLVTMKVGEIVAHAKFENLATATKKKS
jgi:hypothetical protein